MTRLRGTFTALITPFKQDGSLDLEGYRLLVQKQLEAGVTGLIPLGTTGETPTLEDDEELEIIRITVEEAAAVKGRKVPVIVGAGSNATHSAVKYAKRAAAMGADAALVVCPYYNKPTNEGIYLHFKAVCEEGGLPVMVYNIAGRTARNIDTPTLERIAGLPGIIGVKEGSGDVAQMMDVIQRIGRNKPDFCVLSGDDALTLPLMALGGDGVVSVASNIVPGRVSDMVDAALEGDLETARIRHYDLLPLFRGLFIETNPIPIKQAMAWAGLPAGSCRLPLCGMEEANKPKLKAALAAAGIQLG
jgi:4-hydroxy-tetrahydrodipicolinate synthase